MPTHPYSISSAAPPRRLGETLLVVAAVGIGGACTTSTEPTVDEVFEAYTEGVVTEVVEVAPDEWRIADERVVADTNATSLVARRLDGTVDTISGAALDNLANTAQPEQQRAGGGFGLGSLLLYSYLGRRLFAGSARGYAGPSSQAYVNSGTFNRVQQTTGQRLNATSRTRTVSRPAGGRSGFGSGRAGRGFGG